MELEEHGIFYKIYQRKNWKMFLENPKQGKSRSGHLFKYGGHLLKGQQINYWLDILHFPDIGEKMEVQWGSTSAVYGPQARIWFS
jgi:hypothetical protein